MEAAVREVGYAYLLQRLVHAAEVLLLRRGEGAEAAGRAHEHDVAHAVIEGRVRTLWDVGDELGRLADAQRLGVAALDRDAARVVAQQAQYAAEERALAHAVGAEYGEEFPGLGLEADAVEHLPLAVGEAEVLNFDAHSFSPLPVMSQRKNGAPMKAVSMPMGMPEVVTFLETLSTMSRKVPPPSMEQGMSQR